jgi:hypothetical protein
MSLSAPMLLAEEKDARVGKKVRQVATAKLPRAVFALGMKSREVVCRLSAALMTWVYAYFCAVKRRAAVFLCRRRRVTLIFFFFLPLCVFTVLIF